MIRHDLTYPDGRRAYVYGDDVVGSLDAIPADSGYSVDGLHRRFDRLTGAWVLVSPSRNSRPATGVGGAGRDAPPACPLCPGGGELVAPFHIAAFENRFPSMAVEAPMPALESSDIGRSGGYCEVVVFSPDHVAEVDDQRFVDVITVLRDRTSSLWAEGHRCVMAFENHGAEVGATLPHTHGQIYAFDHLPPTVVAKIAQHDAARGVGDGCLGCFLATDRTAGDRVVFRNVTFTAAIPFAARWPLEVHVRAHDHGVRRLADLDEAGVRDLAEAIRSVLQQYRGVWGFDLPYMMCVHEAPNGEADEPLDDWHLYVELIPPNRNATRLKIRASVETALGTFINDTLPEDNAAMLRAAPIDGDWSSIVVPTIGPAS
jgi:UDPglucose--hexose-1-phosphate uridylyltransferase